jgi:endonuclease/exonuclease/phosphatase family metal-dependent hydrolase
MHLAYKYGVKDIWIVNVGDIKPMEFPISFFLDYAWNPEKIGADDLQKYTGQWAAAQFGNEHAEEIADIISKYGKYNGRRKPELLDDKTYNLDNYNEFKNVVKDYNDLFINNADVFCKLTSNKHTFRLIPPTNDLLGKVMHYGDPVYIDNMSYMLGNNFDTTYYIGNTDRPAAFYMQPAYAPLMSLGSQIYNSKYSNNDKTFLRILAYNIWMLPDFLGHIIKSSPNKLERSDGIIKLISTIDPDVLVITEVFDNPTRKSILNKLKMYGYYFETPCVGINQKSGAINGGIIVISKYQIITSKQEVFRSSCSDDYLANKGIIYVKLMINNTSYHIFGVHMQAWESDTCITTRKDQLNQLLEFASKQNINSNDVVIYAGDFNIDKYSDKTNNEYTDMINKLNVTDPQKYNMTPTIDSQRNKLANGSTVSNIGKSEIVDYILVSNEHKKINVIKNGIIRPKLDSNDLSDHYPIFIDIDLDTNYK